MKDMGLLKSKDYAMPLWIHQSSSISHILASVPSYLSQLDDNSLTAEPWLVVPTALHSAHAQMFAS